MNKITNLINEELKREYARGLYSGLVTLEDVIRRFKENHKLIEPLSMETLIEFAEQDMKELKERIKL